MTPGGPSFDLRDIEVVRMLHYNPPYGDIYMEVAVCAIDNIASRRTLERAGMVPGAHIMRGKICC